MQIQYIDEYQPSCACLTLQDPIYKVSQKNEQIRVSRLAVPSAALIILPLIIFGGLAVYFATRK